MDESRLLLIDAHGMVYRSFFAISGLSTSAGTPTNALFGFIRNERLLRQRWRPTHVCAVFDGGLPVERTELVETYKAQRPPMPDDLAAQMPLVKDYCRLAGLHPLRIEKQEADDVMATLAAEGLCRGAKILLATGDKDLFQCVGDDVRIVPLAGKGEPLDAAGIERKTGVPPGLIVPWLALVGDSSDNIDGVPGVGPKTAARWLREFGSWPAILENRDRLEPRRFRAVLAEYAELVDRNVRMIGLRTDLDCGISWSELLFNGCDSSGLAEFLRKYELSSLADYQQVWGGLI